MPSVVVAEKPSVARDMAAVLGATVKGEGHLHGNGWVVTWAVGHLVALPQPHQIETAWKAWRQEHLPMLPRRWPLVVMEQTQDQFQVVKRLITAKDVDRVVCATDAGREGELIFRLIYEAAGCNKPTQRLWISSLTADAIKKGFAALEPGHSRDRLAAAARGRAQADWLVGMNLSRAYTLLHGDTLTVGRVQTPTLAMLVDREHAITTFVPVHYVEVEGTFGAPGGAYQGTWFAPGVALEGLKERKRLPGDGVLAARIVERVGAQGNATVEQVKQDTRRMPPPLLYDLTELQRHANRLYGFSAQHTLDTAQKLYEVHKLLSYPRTDSRHVSASVAATLGQIVGAVSGPYAAMLAPGTGERALGHRFVDDTQVTDHHAIIPTCVDPRSVSLSADEARLHDLVCRRFLSAWHGDHVWAVTTVVTRVDSVEGPDRFHSGGSAVVDPGWKVLDVQTAKSKPRKAPQPEDGDDDAADQDLPSGLAPGLGVGIKSVEPHARQTRPPKRFTDAMLLTAMEGAGKLLDDQELSRAMKDRGLGTPATRAAIMENLLKREYVLREGKLLVPTPKGIGLIALVHPQVKSPAMTGDWEAQLHGVERGTVSLMEFTQRVEEYVRTVVALAGSLPPRSVPPPGSSTATPAPGAPLGAVGPSSSATLPPRQRPTGDLPTLLHRVFGHTQFRPHQEDVCRAVLAGQNALLVMPTGAGKSLCYQLPGLARGGTTLVISPLIALMEDQVAKLKQLGLTAERIHSGRDRMASRAACQAYLAGELDYLFIAPERLAVPNFPEMLARRKPTLIAVDEAHCISQWGHDFRPEYRMLKQRLPLLAPAPIMALTATATPLVQQDIVEQLGFVNAKRFIHGFRRTNLGIEVVEVPKPQRMEVARALLRPPERRPAILYAPSRADAEELAGILAGDFPCAAYHAGLPAKTRAQVQTAFLNGQLHAVVATIAFGMGIDKADIRTVVHLALPQSLEGYYQEIGRAGRDGLPSRAALLHSYVDRRMHEFFREHAYPPVETLQALLKRVPETGVDREALKSRCRLDGETFDTALEKLWIHGAVLVDSSEQVSRGKAGWQQSYLKQLEHRIDQEESIARFAQVHGCRMKHLVTHFGDTADSGEPCGVCDHCNAGACMAQPFREPTAMEKHTLTTMLQRVHDQGNVATGTLFRDMGQTGMDRSAFEALMSGLVRAHLLQAQSATFEKDGKTITYQRVSVPAGVQVSSQRVLDGVKLPDALPASGGGGRAHPKPKGKKHKRTPAASPGANMGLVERLKSWRKKEAGKRGVPAFRIMADTVMMDIALRAPSSAQELEGIRGVGPAFLKQHGNKVLTLVAQG